MQLSGALQIAYSVETLLYSSDFESFTVGPGNLVGNANWLGINTSSTSQGIQVPPSGAGQAAFLGKISPQNRAEQQVYRPIAFDPETAGQPVINVSFDVGISDHSTGSSISDNQFEFDLYAKDSTLTAGILLDHNPGVEGASELYYFDGAKFQKTYIRVNDGTLSRVEISLDYEKKVWSLRFGGKLIFHQQPVSVAAGTALSLGGIQFAEYFNKDPNALPSDDAVIFDNITVRASNVRAPVITQHPSSRLVNAGSAVKFSVQAEGTAPFSYQWQRNGSNIPGANSAEFTVPSVSAGDNNSLYRVIVSNGSFAQESNEAALLVVNGSSARSIVGWGLNSSGQLNVPGGIGDVLSIAAGGSHSLALRSDMSVVGWGANDSGQITAPSGLKAVAIAAGGSHSLAIRAGGSVVGWGNDTYGQVSGASGYGAIAIAAGARHSIALHPSGQVVAWGSNYEGSFGGGTYRGQATVPEGLKNVVAIAAGSYHNLALKSDGTVVAWGSNSYGQCNVPAGLSGVVAISANWNLSIAAKSDGSIVAWGMNDSGQASPPSSNQTVALSAGERHGLALQGDGTVLAWGAGSGGQSGGYPNFGQATVPANLTGVTAIAAGSQFSLALLGTRPAPLISSQSASTRVRYGSNYTLSATALSVVRNGTPIAPVTYQWYQGQSGDVSKPVAGASGSTLALPALTQTTDYWVRASDVGGNTFGETITLTVDQTPEITVQPSGQSALPGQAVTLQVTAVGPPPLSYQWQKDGVDLPGQAGSTLQIPEMRSSDQGAYQVKIANAHGSTVSAIANVAVVEYASGIDLRLVRDLNSTQIGNSVLKSAKVGNLIYFVAQENATDFSLWKTDGTVQGTTRVRPLPEFAADLRGGSPYIYMGSIGNTLLLSVQSKGLWRSDGTASGTYSLSGPADSPSFRLNSDRFYEWKNAAYFAGSTTSEGNELWRTDGTIEGTYMVKDIYPGLKGTNTASGSPGGFVTYGSSLYFSAEDGSGGRELWKTDGTGAGTVLVKDLYPGSSNGTPFSGSPYEFTISGGKMFFVASDATNGSELWISDGTQDGTMLVKDINPGSASSQPGNLVDMGGTLFFVATTPTAGRELWKSDGTAAGTVMVRDISAGSQSSPYGTLTPFKGYLYFLSRRFINGDYEPAYLWRTDGTEAGTQVFASVRLTGFIRAAEDLLYFGVETSDGTALYTTDGSTTGTQPVKDAATGATIASPSDAIVLNGKLFASLSDSAHGGEPFLIDAPSGRAILLRDILQKSGESYVGSLVKFKGKIYFSAFDGVHGSELWCSDGTEKGTRMLKDIATGSASSAPRELVVVGEYLYFSADDITHGFELWRSDGTEAGTELVVDLEPRSDSSGSPYASAPTNLANGNGTLYFSAQGSSGTGLWKSDGTAAGTVFVSGVVPRKFVSVGSTVFFVGSDSLMGNTTGEELWKTDGTAAGTVLVKDINPAYYYPNPWFRMPSSSGIQQPVNLNGTLFFIADNGTNGTELWRSDGTPGGTLMVADVNPGSGSGAGSNLVVFDGKVYFPGNNSAFGYELWMSDGTAAGTVLCADLTPGSGSSNPAQLTVVGNQLYFGIGSSNSPAEIWKSDGTAAGTVRVKRMTYNGFSPASDFTLVNGRVYFSCSDAKNGSELWVSDGTSAGTSIIRDLYPGRDSSGPSNLTALGSRLFFTATTFDTGSELFVINQAPHLSTEVSLEGAIAGHSYEIAFETLATALNLHDAEDANLELEIVGSVNGTLLNNGVPTDENAKRLKAGEIWSYTPPADVEGTTVAFQVKAWDGSLQSEETATVIIDVLGLPKVLTQPGRQVLEAGESATLSVVATGRELTYQWYRGSSGNKSDPISGATAATLMTEPLQANVSFWVAVRNSAGEIYSSTAAVVVRQHSNQTGAGTYTGVIGAGESDNGPAGSIVLTLSTSGSFTGTVALDGVRNIFKGTFDHEGRAIVLLRNGTWLELVLTSSDGIIVLHGGATSQSGSSSIVAAPARFSKKEPFHGATIYNFLLRSAQTSTGNPTGFVHGTTKTTGAVRGVGRTPGGIAFSFGAVIDWNDAVMVNAKAARKGGTVLGFLPVREAMPSEQLLGSLKWTPVNSAAQICSVEGGAYIFEPGKSVFGTDFTQPFNFIARSAPDDQLSLVAQGQTNRSGKISIAQPDAGRLSLKIDRQGGLFSGNYTLRSTRAKWGFSGVIVPSLGIGAGPAVNRAQVQQVEIRPVTSITQ